jgi:hypothetical protein
MKNSSDEECEMEERLKYICGLVNDWLKFAEAKNAAMVAAVCALVAVLCDHFPESNGNALVQWMSVVGCVLLMLAGLCSLVSFLPKLTFKWSQTKVGRSAEHNLFYFEHIGGYSAFEYLEALYQAESHKPANKKLEADLAGQAVINSRITSGKFRQFKLACACLIGGLIVLGIAASLHILKLTYEHS